MLQNGRHVIQLLWHQLTFFHNFCCEITVPNQLYDWSVGPGIPFILTAVILPSLLDLDLASVMDSSSVSVLQPRPIGTLSNLMGTNLIGGLNLPTSIRIGLMYQSKSSGDSNPHCSKIFRLDSSPQLMSLELFPLVFSHTKGEIISKANFEVFIWTKNWTKIFLFFCPRSLEWIKLRKNNTNDYMRWYIITN